MDGYKAAIGIYDPPTQKVRVFWWRVLHNIIPTPTNLKTHHVPTSGLCPLCHVGYDSTGHALFACPEIKSCWKSTQLWSMLKKVKLLDVLDIFGYMHEHLSKKEFEVFAMHTYALWLEQLRVLHNQNHKNKTLNTDWSMAALYEFQGARKLSFTSSNHVSYRAYSQIWRAPPTNQLKLNVDVAYYLNFNLYAIGGVIRDHEGQPVRAVGQKIDQPPSVVYGEPAAINEGIQITGTNNIAIHHISSISLLTIQAVMRPEEDLSFVGTFATVVRRFLDKNGSLSLLHERRSTNTVAHALASFAISSPTLFVWKHGDFPLWYVKLVIKDLELI